MKYRRSFALCAIRFYRDIDTVRAIGSRFEVIGVFDLAMPSAANRQTKAEPFTNSLMYAPARSVENANAMREASVNEGHD